MNNKVKITPIDDLVSNAYGKYAKYIIQDRALPDIRDGLKPVQRRILYAMHELNIFFDKPYKKSARTVGEVIGKYHPHGDSSIYDAMVRMSQDWKNNLCLIDMHGNKGSIDGDNAAAMRYTESRLAKVANIMLWNLKKENIVFIPNFDDQEKEPSVLPSLIPNLLINGASGIASGYATNIPPHNPSEVFDALIYLLKTKKPSFDELIKIIKAPDFPTGGEIHGISGVVDSYKTGAGKFLIRASMIEKTDDKKINQLIIKSIPYETNKAEIIRSIEQLMNNKELEYVLEIRDESDINGISIVLDVRKEASLLNLQNFLYKKTNLQVTYHTKFISIVDRAPKQVDLISYFTWYIKFALEVIKKTDQYDLNKVILRLEIVEGLIKAIDYMDEIIKIIRHSDSKNNAKDNLKERFKFTENQAEAIVMMRLYRLTKTNIDELNIEKENLIKEQRTLNERINSEDVAKQYFISVIKNYRKDFDQERKTKIVEEIKELTINQSEMVMQSDLILSVSKEGYIKTLTKKAFEASDYNNPGLKKGDIQVLTKLVNSHDYVCFITTSGKIYYTIIYKIKTLKWKELGVHLSSMFKTSLNEHIIKVITFNEKTKPNDYQLILLSSDGMVKRIDLAELNLMNEKKESSIIKLNDDASLIGAELIRKNNNYLLYGFNTAGECLLIPSDEVNLLNKNAKGIRFMKQKPNDRMVKLFVSKTNDVVLNCFFNIGYTSIPLTEIPLKKRAQAGVSIYEKGKNKVELVSICQNYKENAFYLKNEENEVFAFIIKALRQKGLSGKLTKYEIPKIIDIQEDSYLNEVHDNFNLHPTLNADEIKVDNEVISNDEKPLF
ncbi:DNA topoisomerase IV subunit A [Ureaplasma canigenitalium]|uniref:DNA topoisomerase IV subunit A n=1 Tax=Ureaplasma canigenitalium TaxID=42092 RepID=UPI0004E15F07|nr:DNA topoisomerase IV subunit A [Ureaplasma canigenitalium]